MFTKSFGSLDGPDKFILFIYLTEPPFLGLSLLPLDFTFFQLRDCILSTAMEYHSVPPEERARDEDGNLLPWGYVYKEYVQRTLNSSPIKADKMPP
jgi:hypothetical protein